MAQSIDGAMAEALSHLNRIANHFRRHGQHKPANDIGKLSIMIVNAFSEGIEHIPVSEYSMEDDLSLGTATAESSKIRQIAMKNPIHQQAVAALMNELEKGQKTGVGSYINGMPKSQLGAENQPPGGSWAQVASAMSNLDSNVPEMTQYSMSSRPISSLQSSNNNKSRDPDNNEMVLRTSALAGSDMGSPLSQEMPGEAKAGVIRILGKISKDFIQFVTTRIHEGPLYDMRIESAQSARVTFQHASHALAFLKSHEDMEKMLGFGRFGSAYHVELAELVDWNEDHRKMNQPTRERRRLSFARKRLFSEGMSSDKWKQDIRALAGPGNIDFLWVFNSGNATAVFTSTRVARRVLEAFDKWKSGRTVYNGVSVTYSSDPCEKELVLVKETARPVIMKSYNRKPIR